MIGFSRAPTWVAWTSMVVFLLTSLFPTGGALVLCIGQDGHVAIEVATADADCSDCAPASAPVVTCCSDPLDLEQDPTDCSCSDIPIHTGSVASSASLPPQGVKIPFACSLAVAQAIVPPPLPRSSGPQDRSRSLLCPRVPAPLILRI